MVVNELIDFLKNSKQPVFIEAEGKPKHINKFIMQYNTLYSHNPISSATDGIITLKPDANKWALELRLYLMSRTGMPTYWHNKTTKNDKYRGDFSYRINDNDLLYELFRAGYQIGCN